MSRMVSRYLGECTYQQAELQGFMDSKGNIKYSLIRNNRNLGDVTAEKDQVIKNFKMHEVFNDEEAAKEEFELLGFLL